MINSKFLPILARQVCTLLQPLPVLPASLCVRLRETPSAGTRAAGTADRGVNRIPPPARTADQAHSVSSAIPSPSHKSPKQIKCTRTYKMSESLANMKQTPAEEMYIFTSSPALPGSLCNNDSSHQNTML